MSNRPLLSEVPVVTRHNIAQFNPADALTGGALLLIDKPSDWTSFDVVAKVRNLLRIRKIGHTGTLDPMATGLLVLCLGKATKLVEELQSGRKEYTGTIRLGATMTTDDAEGEPSGEYPTEHITEAMVAEAVRGFIGTSMQTPPMYSARKVAGRRLYTLARKGQQIEVPPREITIEEFEITSVTLPDLSFRIVCSKGTYIRAIARDLGSRLGSGGFLDSLRRTVNGAFVVEDALTIGEIGGF